jgi:peptide/nickel transport system substrate-binding protein
MPTERHTPNPRPVSAMLKLGRRRLATAALVLALPLAGALLAGCGGSGSSSTTGGSAAPASTSGGAAAPQSSATSGIPQNNEGDHDSDNNGGPSDGDGEV